MFIAKSRRRSDSLNSVCDRYVVSDNGLGANEYSGQTKIGKTVLPIIGQATKLIGTATGTGLLTTIVPSKVLNTVGIKINPLSIGLAPFTFGASLLPGVSEVLGKVFDVFSGMFKKATEMESCMNWWTDSNIRGMINGVSPYPINVVSLFPEASREYRLEHADEVTGFGPIQRALNPAKRQGVIVGIYVSAVRSASDVMEAQCAVTAKSKGEDTGITLSQADVDVYWRQLKDAAIQKEAESVISEITSIMAPYQSVANQKTATVETTRQAGLVTTDSGGKGFQLPEGVMSISKGGSLILDVSKNMNKVIDMTVGKPTIRKK